jgi:hypothetical protein
MTTPPDDREITWRSYQNLDPPGHIVIWLRDGKEWQASETLDTTGRCYIEHDFEDAIVHKEELVSIHAAVRAEASDAYWAHKALKAMPEGFADGL